MRGEGGVAIVLQRSDVQNMETSYAQILGSAVNQDGRSASFTAPNGMAQRQLLRDALMDAQIQPEQVDLIEAHGTGTALGDPIEAAAIVDVYGNPSDCGRGCDALIVTAVKANVGHLEGVAGLVGVLKTIAALQHGQLPPNKHTAVLNPLVAEAIDEKNCDRRLIFPSSVVDVRSDSIAGVSSFGSGGKSLTHLCYRKFDKSFLLSRFKRSCGDQRSSATAAIAYFHEAVSTK